MTIKLVAVPLALVARRGPGKQLLGWTLLILGLLVLTGGDKYFEALAVDVLPEWVYSLESAAGTAPDDRGSRGRVARRKLRRTPLRLLNHRSELG